MFETRHRVIAPALALAIIAISLAGCDSTQDGDPSPPLPPSTFEALFNPLAGVSPWPTDLLFLGTDDGTINFSGLTEPFGKPPFTTAGSALSTLDGFSTIGYTSTSFNLPIDPASVGATTVHVVELKLNNDKSPAGVTRKLVYGVDFKAEVSPDVDSGGKWLRITPLKPFKASSGPVAGPGGPGVIDNVGYLFLVTNGVRDTSQLAAQPDDTYAAIKAAPDCTGFTGVANSLCLLIKGHLQIAQGVGVNPASVVVSWNYSTQSTADVSAVAASLAPSSPISLASKGLTTAQYSDATIPLGALPGKADIYQGTMTVPYYLGIPASVTDATVLSKFWRAAGSSPVPGINADSRNLTRFNPFPAKSGDVTIPVLVTLPNATANNGAGCSKPAGGWPIAVFQHGIPRSRTDALLIADGLADNCIVMVAVDLPLHGITDPTNPLYDAQHERTFNLDLRAPAGTDPTGTHFLNFANPLQVRDNYRQGAADIVALFKSLPGLDVDGDVAPDVDPTRIHFIGLSNGAITGVPALPFVPFRTVGLADVGGGLTQTLLESERQSGPAIAFLNSQGLVPNSTIFNNTVLRDFQALADPADPSNYIAAAAALRPLYMTRVVGDTNVPNSAFDRLVTASGVTQLQTAGLTPIGPGTGRWLGVTEGSHGALIYPQPSLAATIELQTQHVSFIATTPGPDGPSVLVTNTSIVE
jgi:hypothetical protein